MCLATLSTKAGKRFHAVPLALPHPRGFISLAEQQQLETANQHAVSKGRLRWQLRARAMLSACCHLVIVFTAGGTAIQLVGRHACQQTLSPAYAQTHTWGRSPEWTPHHHHPNLCVMFFSLLTPPSPIPPPPLQMLGEKKVKTTTNKPRGFLLFLVVLMVGGVVFIQSSLKDETPASILHREGMMQAGRLGSRLSTCGRFRPVTDSFWIGALSFFLLVHSEQ